MMSLSSSVHHWAQAEPDRLALVYGHRRISYGELARRTQALAGMLRARAIGPGDIVALLMKNSAAFVELTLAISHLGAVVLPINYRLGADEVDYILQHGGAKLVCVDEDLAANVGDATALIITPQAQFDAC